MEPGSRRKLGLFARSIKDGVEDTQICIIYNAWTMQGSNNLRNYSYTVEPRLSGHLKLTRGMQAG